MLFMRMTDVVTQTPPDLAWVRARAKVLAREDREMKAKLIRHRRNTGLTQKEVAERMGVTQQAVQKLERYDSDPKLATLRRYANAIGAFVSHEVVPDVGQSVWIAAAPVWEGSAAFPRPITQQSGHQPRVNRGARRWTQPTRTDFAIAR